MQNIRNKLTKATCLTLVLSLMMVGTVFAAGKGTGQVTIGSGTKTGFAYGYNMTAGNATTGLYAEGDTSFTPRGNGCTGIYVYTQMTVKSGTTTLYSKTSAQNLVVNSYGVETWAPTLHSGFHFVDAITATTNHYVTGGLSWTTQLVTNR